MEEKKFLDANGLRILWDKILEEDYTNNSILTAVINAIDEAKADREEVPPLPLQGTTEDITPEDIGMALLEGRNIVLSHNEPNLGVSTFTNFAYNSQLDIITCSTMIMIDNYPVNVQLSGDKDGWHFQILPFIIDPTLSQEGVAADAKAVGDAIANIELTPGPKGDSGVYVGAEEPIDDSVNVWVNPNANPLESILSQLYFKPGDNITTRFWTAGTITNQGKNVHFAIPLDRPMIGVSNLRLEGAKAQIRQNDIYLLGNRDSGSWDEPYGVRLALVNTQGQPNYPLVCTIDFETMPEGAINNDAVGIAFEGTIYFE